jgi:hypothetical protein
MNVVAGQSGRNRAKAGVEEVVVELLKLFPAPVR